MDFARMPVFGICLVLFGFVIVVPGSTLNAIDSATTTRDIKPSTPPAADSPPYLAPTTLTTTATPITIIATTTATARLAGTTIKAPTSTLTTITTRGPSLKLKSYSFTLNNDDDRDVDDDDDDDDDHNGLNTEKTHNDEGDVGNVGIGEAHLEAQSIMSSLSLQGLELPVGGPGVPERTTKANKAGSVGGSERRANNGVAASKGNKGPDNTMPTGAAITTTSTTTAKIVKGTKEMVAGGVRMAAAIVEQVTMVLPAKLVATMIPPTGSSNNNNNNSNNNRIINENSNNNNPATVSSSSSRKKSNTIRSLNDKQVATIAKDDSQYEKDMTVVSSISRSPADNDDEEVEEYVAIAIDVGGGMAAFPAKLVQQPKILYNNNNAIVNNITSNNDKNNNHNNKYTAEQYKEEEAKDVDERGKEEVQQMLWRERQEYIRQVHAAIAAAAAAATASSSAAAESSSPSSGSVSTGTATGRADDVTTIKQDLLAFAFNNNSLIATTTAATAPPSSQSSAVLAGAGENTTIPLSSSPGTFALLGPSAALTTADSSVWGGNQQAPTSTPAQSSSSSSLSPLLTAAVATTTATIRTQLSSTASVFSSSAAATTAAEVTATTPKTTASTTTKRRFPVRTTTMKPPPAIDDYQTITSQAGTHAYLPCNVKQLVKKPISWLRVRDGHILTVDQTTFIADQRFQSIYTTNPERWSLQIKYVQLKDAGTYECQVSTEPKASAIVNLRIVEPRTELIGEPTRHVKAGSQVKLHCIISQALEPPLYINWFYNQKQIYLHNHKGWRTEIERIDLPPAPPPTRPATRPPTTTTRRPAATQLSATTIAATGTTASGGLGSGSGITAGAAMRRTSVVPSTSSVSSLSSSLSSMSEMLTNEVDLLAASGPGHAPGSATTAAQPAASANVVDVNQITTASLIIPAVQKLDSGNYTCSPSNSAPRTVVLHVLNGEYSASAITSGCASPAAYKISWEKPWQEWLGAIFVVFAIGFVKFILEHAVVNGDRLKLLNTLLWRDAEDTSRTSEHDKRTGGVWKTTTTRILNRIARGEYT